MGDANLVDRVPGVIAELIQPSTRITHTFFDVSGRLFRGMAAIYLLNPP